MSLTPSDSPVTSQSPGSPQLSWGSNFRCPAESAASFWNNQLRSGSPG